MEIHYISYVSNNTPSQVFASHSEPPPSEHVEGPQSNALKENG